MVVDFLACIDTLSFIEDSA